MRSDRWFNGPVERSAAWRCLALVLLVKALWFFADSTVRLFMGDSASYLHSALTGWIPPDRSFLYGWMIGTAVLPLGSLQWLIVLQSLFGVMSSLLLYGWLRIGIGIPVRVATGAAALFALEPAQVFYERMVMAEATGFLALAAFFVCVCVYVRNGRWHWMAAYISLGLLAVAMRLSLMPVVLAFGLLAPAVRFAFGAAFVAMPWRRRLLRIIVHTLVAAVLTQITHGIYKHGYGRLAQVEPDYTAQSGVFRMGLVLPLVKPEHLVSTGIDLRVLDAVSFDIHDPRAREAHLWMDGGFMAALSKYADQPYQKAAKLSIRAIRDDPFGLVRLGLSTVADYFDEQVRLHRLLSDLGRTPPTPEQIEHFRRDFGYDAAGVAELDSPASLWFSAGAWWLGLCLFLLAPLAVVTLVWRWHAPGRDLRVLLCLASLGLVAQHVLFSHIVSFRYLHPLPWFMLANLAVLWSTRSASTQTAHHAPPIDTERAGSAV